MDRRGFIGALASVSAAILGGIRLPSSTEIATATPEAAAVSAQLEKLLKWCKPVAISQSSHDYSSDALDEVVVMFIDERSDFIVGDASFNVSDITRGLRPVSFTRIKFHPAGESELIALKVTYR
jgi:hypothetical protein